MVSSEVRVYASFGVRKTEKKVYENFGVRKTGEKTESLGK
jgi:hypothetical protein